MQSPLRAGRPWLLAVSTSTVATAALFVFASSPQIVSAHVMATESKADVLAVEGTLTENGTPLSHVIAVVKEPIRVHGKWQYRLLGHAKTNSGGRFDIVIYHARPHTYFVAFVDHHKVIKRYVYVRPDQAVALDMNIATGFELAGIQTFVY